MFVPVLILALSCEGEVDNDENRWHQANLRKQDVFVRRSGQSEGWLATQVPYEMAQDLIGREPLEQCLSDVSVDGFCDIVIPGCMEIKVPKSWPVGEEPYVTLVFSTRDCQTLLSGPQVEWFQQKQNGGKSVPWSRPGVVPVDVKADDVPDATTAAGDGL